MPMTSRSFIEADATGGWVSTFRSVWGPARGHSREIGLKWDFHAEV